MSNKEAELTAYCGLYCGDCLRYKSKVTELARDLMSELQAVRFDRYAEVKSAFVKEFEHYKEFREVLEATARLRCNTPCRLGGDGCLQPCEIKRCAQSKNLDGCWECDEFEKCEKFEFLKPLHSDNPQANLREIKKHGLDRWVKHRGKFYRWL